jgi:antitoxin VapB
MRKEGNRLIIEPVLPKSLLDVLATLQPLSEDFPPIVDLPADPVGQLPGRRQATRGGTVV